MIHENKLKEIISELSNMKSVGEKYKSQKQKYQLKSHETEILQQRLAQNPHHQVRFVFPPFLIFFSGT